MTTKEMIRSYNVLAADRGLPALNGWKASKEALQAKIDGLMIQTAADPLALPSDTEAVQTLGEPSPDQVPPDVAEETTDEHTEPDEAPEVIVVDRFVPAGMVGPDDEVVDLDKFTVAVQPKGIGRMVRELLVDPEGYDYAFIVEAVRREFPDAHTSKRSVASVAAGLRREGVEVPMRRKPRKA